MSLFSDLTAGLRYTRAIAGLWRAPVDMRDPVASLRAMQAVRDSRFVQMFARTVFGYPRSPYLPLLHAAGICEADIAVLVRERGLEGTLRHLYEAGVHVSLAEFKGDSPLPAGEPAGRDRRHGL